MAVTQASGLAVARLAELRPARSHRYHDGKPMEGFCLITSDSGFSRVTVHVENGQTLTDRSGSGGFYYEGWLVGPAGIVSLGAFNLGPDGRGSATRVVAASQVQPGRAELVRVTVEPFGGSRDGAIAVLEGKLVWLDAPAAAPQPVSPAAAGAPAPAQAFGTGPGEWSSRTGAPGFVSSRPGPVAPAAGPAPAASPAPGAPLGQAGAALSRSGAADGGGSFGVFAGSATGRSGGAPAGDVAKEVGAGVAVLPEPSAGTASGDREEQSGGATPGAVAQHPDGAAGMPAGQFGDDTASAVALPPGGAAPGDAAGESGADVAAIEAAQSDAGVSAAATGQSGGDTAGDLPGPRAGLAAADPFAPVSSGAEGDMAAWTDQSGPADPEQAAAGAQPDAAGSVPAQPAPRHVNPLSVQVNLVQRHPMTPRATGTATLNLRRGHLSLSLRGLPSPTALGRDQKSGRPFNAYRVWLINQKNQMRTPVGYCERVWGENFRFEADGLPLNRSDTILITAEDRSVAASVGHPAPQVLIGSYDPRI